MKERKKVSLLPGCLEKLQDRSNIKEYVVDLWHEFKKKHCYQDNILQE